MEFSLINAGLAAGAALAALPVILHLFMKQQPKHVIFPALRLIRERQKRSKKKLRVKNWLLLLARMALVALMALALARPRLARETTVGDQEVPTAMALVFDTSLSMGYKQPDKTRLDLAKERAYELIKKTPGTSQVFVIDSFEPGNPPPLSPAAARKRVEGLTLHAVNRPLNAAVGQAYAAVAGSDRPRHEVYVLTDLARSAWDMERTVEGLDASKKDKAGVKTYVLRLTPRDVRDVSVVEARPPSDVVSEGEPVEIKARIRSLGPPTERVAQLEMDNVTRDKQPVKLDANGEATVLFKLPKFDASTAVHQGSVRVTGPDDPLAFDDVRYFTFSVKPAPNVLVVSDLPADAEFVADAVDPHPGTLPPGAPRPFRVDRAEAAKLRELEENLGKRYRAIFVNNVTELTEDDWRRLSTYVLDGGGLVIGLGGRSDAENYRSTPAEQLLPGTVDKVATPKEPTTFGEVADYTHPLFTRYPRELAEILSQVPVAKFWRVTPHKGSRVLLSYTDKSPALLERVFKRSRTGRVLLWTTPLSRRPDPNSPDAWNEFPVTGWSFFYLMRQSVSYLAETAEESLIFDAGGNVVLPIDPTRRYKNYIVHDPDRKPVERLSPNETSNSLVVVAPQQLGNWTVKASGTEGNSEVIGFSVNAPEAETRFVPLEEPDLTKLFGGKDKYALADDPDKIEQIQQKVRVGTELFPWLMVVIMVVVTVESVLANRFYREAGQRGAVPQAA